MTKLLHDPEVLIREMYMYIIILYWLSCDSLCIYIHVLYTGFIVVPLSQNVTVGTTVSFHCQHSTGSIFWNINSTRTEDFPSVSIKGENGLYTLTITEPSLEFNGTEIRYLAYLTNRNSELAMIATLLLQGWCSCT